MNNRGGIYIIKTKSKTQTFQLLFQENKLQNLTEIYFCAEIKFVGFSCLLHLENLELLPFLEEANNFMKKIKR